MPRHHARTAAAETARTGDPATAHHPVEDLRRLVSYLLSALVDARKRHPCGFTDNGVIVHANKRNLPGYGDSALSAYTGDVKRTVVPRRKHGGGLREQSEEFGKIPPSDSVIAARIGHAGYAVTLQLARIPFQAQTRPRPSGLRPDEAKAGESADMQKMPGRKLPDIPVVRAYHRHISPLCNGIWDNLLSDNHKRESAARQPRRRIVDKRIGENESVKTVFRKPGERLRRKLALGPKEPPAPVGAPLGHVAENPRQPFPAGAARHIGRDHDPANLRGKMSL